MNTSFFDEAVPAPLAYPQYLADIPASAIDDTIAQNIREIACR
jgi:hypothetical protein